VWRNLPVINCVPDWIAKTPSSHRMYERGGIFACAACGGIGAYKPQKLLKECSAEEGHRTDAISIIRYGNLPRGHSRWPSGWEGVRPPPLQKVIWNTDTPRRLRCKQTLGAEATPAGKRVLEEPGGEERSKGAHSKAARTGEDRSAQGDKPSRPIEEHEIARRCSKTSTRARSGQSPPRGEPSASTRGCTEAGISSAGAEAQKEPASEVLANEVGGCKRHKAEASHRPRSAVQQDRDPEPTGDEEAEAEVEELNARL